MENLQDITNNGVPVTWYNNIFEVPTGTVSISRFLFYMLNCCLDSGLTMCHQLQ